MKQQKQSKCRENAEGCHGYYIKQSSFQATCHNPLCALQKAKRDRVKKEDKDRSKRAAMTREAKKKAKTRTEWLREAQTVFNAYLRTVDHDQPCISCNRYHSGQYHAGHYMSVGSTPELRFTEINVWKQCSVCNMHLSGNICLFRKNLVAKLGEEAVLWIEEQNYTHKFSIEELTNISLEYKVKLKKLKEEINGTMERYPWVRRSLPDKFTWASDGSIQRKLPEWTMGESFGEIPRKGVGDKQD